MELVKVQIALPEKLNDLVERYQLAYLNRYNKRFTKAQVVVYFAEMGSEKIKSKCDKMEQEFKKYNEL